MRESVSLSITNQKHPALSGLNSGDKLKGTLYAQSVLPLEHRNIDILATTEQGQPAVVSTWFGKGEAMLAGSYLGMANFPDVDPINDRFFTNLLKWAKIERPFSTSLDGRTTSQVEVRLQENSKGYVVFVINHSSEEEVIDIDLKITRNINFRIRDVINDTEELRNGANNLLRLNTTLEGKHVKVWEISPE
jgi:beta-galactosidase